MNSTTRKSRASGETRCYGDWLSVQDPQETITTTTFSTPHTPLTTYSVAPPSPPQPSSQPHAPSVKLYHYTCDEKLEEMYFKRNGKKKDTGLLLTM